MITTATNSITSQKHSSLRHACTQSKFCDLMAAAQRPLETPAFAFDTTTTPTMTASVTIPQANQIHKNDRTATMMTSCYSGNKATLIKGPDPNPRERNEKFAHLHNSANQNDPYVRETNQSQEGFPNKIPLTKDTQVPMKHSPRPLLASETVTLSGCTDVHRSFNGTNSLATCAALCPSRSQTNYLNRQRPDIFAR